MYPIFSLSNTKKEKLLATTFERNTYTVIHSMSKRKFEVINKSNNKDSFQLEIGEILILDGNLQISRGPMVKRNKVIEIQISIGYIGFKEWKIYNEIG